MQAHRQVRNGVGEVAGALHRGRVDPSWQSFIDLIFAGP
jgi:hypothetical protein